MQRSRGSGDASWEVLSKRGQNRVAHIMKWWGDESCLDKACALLLNMIRGLGGERQLPLL